eukprot:1420089-Rhodomonas_salina.2
MLILRRVGPDAAVAVLLRLNDANSPIIRSRSPLDRILTPSVCPSFPPSVCSSFSPMRSSSAVSLCGRLRWILTLPRALVSSSLSSYTSLSLCLLPPGTRVPSRVPCQVGSATSANDLKVPSLRLKLRVVSSWSKPSLLCVIRPRSSDALARLRRRASKALFASADSPMPDVSLSRIDVCLCRPQMPTSGFNIWLRAVNVDRMKPQV